MNFELEDNGLAKVHGPFEKVIEVPDGVDFIGTAAFADIQEVEVICFPNSVEWISEAAVINCPNLKEVRIGSKVERIDSDAFSTCKKMKNVYINRPKNKVKIHAHAFPKKVEIIFEGNRREENKRYDISIKEIRKTCKLTSRNTGYSINDFSKDGRIEEKWDSKRNCTYQFRAGVEDRTIFIPDTIDGNLVGHIAFSKIPDNAVILCSKETFIKLSRSHKASTSLEYLLNRDLFGEDEIEEIKLFMAKNPDTLIPGILQCNEEQLAEYLSIAAPKKETTEKLVELFEGYPMHRMQVMEYQNRSKSKNKA